MLDKIDHVKTGETFLKSHDNEIISTTNLIQIQHAKVDWLYWLGGGSKVHRMISNFIMQPSPVELFSSIR